MPDTMLDEAVRWHCVRTGFEAELTADIAIRRALVSTIPLIAEAAALDLAEIGAEYVPEIARHEFPVEVIAG